MKRCNVADFEDGGRSLEPRNADGLKLEVARKHTLSLEPLEGTHFYQHLGFFCPVISVLDF